MSFKFVKFVGKNVTAAPWADLKCTIRFDSNNNF